MSSTLSSAVAFQMFPSQELSTLRRGKSACLKDLMIEILYKHCTSLPLSKFCLNQTRKPRGINHTLSYHPEMMYLLYLHLKDGTSRTIWSDHIQSLVEFAQDRDIDSSFSLMPECWMDDNHPATIHQVITATQSQVVLNVTPDYISKRVGTRIHPEGFRSRRELKSLYPLKML